MTKQLRIYTILLLALTLVFTMGLLTKEGNIASGEILEAPSLTHPCGTDVLGVDILGQVSRSFFNCIFTGILAALFAAVLGGSLGVLSGYVGGKVDTLITFTINIFLSVPELPIMILIGAFLGQSRVNIIVIVGVFSWAPIAKIVRAKTMDIKKSGYLKMAECYGGRLCYLFRVHMYRDILPLVIVNGLFVVGKAIVQESSLAFLGISDPTARSWGLMINKALSYPGIYFTDYWKWWLMTPLICLVCVTVLLRLFAKEFERIMLMD